MPIYQCRDAACTTEIKNSFKPCVNPTVTYEGAVLATYERNWADDSDFYAIVWDRDAQDFRHVEYATTRGWTYHNGATVDATPEVIAEAEQKLAEILTERGIGAAHREADKPVKGRTVESLTTRGKNVGVKGVVKWYGEDAYRSTSWMTYYRVGVKVDGEDKLRYLPAEKVRVIDPPAVDEAEIARHARWMASQHHWRID